MACSEPQSLTRKQSQVLVLGHNLYYPTAFIVSVLGSMLWNMRTLMKPSIYFMPAWNTGYFFESYVSYSYFLKDPQFPKWGTSEHSSLSSSRLSFADWWQLTVLTCSYYQITHLEWRDSREQWRSFDQPSRCRAPLWLPLCRSIAAEQDFAPLLNGSAFVHTRPCCKRYPIWAFKGAGRIQTIG